MFQAYTLHAARLLTRGGSVRMPVLVPDVAGRRFASYCRLRAVADAFPGQQVALDCEAPWHFALQRSSVTVVHFRDASDI
jgi:hypothetical protein